MSARCLDCGSDRVYDIADDWNHGRIPCCPHCGHPLSDVADKPLAVDAEKGWCHARHRTGTPTSYLRMNWRWTHRDLFNVEEFASVGERAELAAHPDIPDPQLDQQEQP